MADVRAFGLTWEDCETPNDIQYLDHLRKAFSLPLEYRVVPL